MVGVDFPVQFLQMVPYAVTLGRAGRFHRARFATESGRPTLREGVTGFATR